MNELGVYREGLRDGASSRVDLVELGLAVEAAALTADRPQEVAEEGDPLHLGGGHVHRSGSPERRNQRAVGGVNLYKLGLRIPVDEDP